MQNYQLFYKGSFPKGSFSFSERVKTIFCAISDKYRGKDVDFKLAWNHPHSVDYALNKMFEWMGNVVVTGTVEKIGL